MGYVGDALASAASFAGFETLGFEIDDTKIKNINARKLKNLHATSDISKIAQMDIVCICVPTPLSTKRKPNYNLLKTALNTVGKYLKNDTLVVIESSVAPGTSRRVALPAIEKNGKKAGLDFSFAYSPERIDPASIKFNINNTPKVVSGFDKNSLKLVSSFYGKFVSEVVEVPQIEVAEMTKVLENTFRLVNISLINELATYATAAGVDIWEVVRAASTKPFGFLTHWPGPGSGGDCIPVLPYHLLDSAKKHKVKLNLVKSAAVVNENQPQKVAARAIEVVNGKMKRIGIAPKVLIVGVSYKEETADLRESPALKIWELLENSGMSVSYSDPFVPKVNGIESKPISKENLNEQDLIIITTAHKEIPYADLVESKRPVIDTKNILSSYNEPNIFKL